MLQYGTPRRSLMLPAIVSISEMALVACALSTGSAARIFGRAPSTEAAEQTMPKCLSLADSSVVARVAAAATSGLRILLCRASAALWVSALSALAWADSNRQTAALAWRGASLSLRCWRSVVFRVTTPRSL